MYVAEEERKNLVGEDGNSDVVCLKTSGASELKSWGLATKRMELMWITV